MKIAEQCQNVSQTLLSLQLCVGGKTSGIFGDSEPPAQPQRPVPPGGTSNVIFGAAGSGPEQSPKKTHPNKPKVTYTQT